MSGPGSPAVARIGGNQRAVEIDPAGHICGHRHLLRFHSDLGLGGDHRGLRGTADERGQRILLIARGVPGAPYRLTVPADQHRLRRIIVVCVAARQWVVGSASRLVIGHMPTVASTIPGVGDHPPDRRPRGRRCRADAGPQVQIRQHRGRNVLKPSRRLP